MTTGTLPGIAAPEIAAPYQPTMIAGTPVCICLLGELLDDVVLVDGARGDVCIHAHLQQRIEHHPHALPVWARLLAPDMGSYASTRAAAQFKALGMLKGRDVVATGQGVETCTHQAAPWLRVIRCTGLVLASSLRLQPSPSQFAPQPTIQPHQEH